MGFEGFTPLRSGDPRSVGRYRLYARLGAGGMGQVYLTFLPGGRAAALKVVRQEFAEDPEFRRRFAVEARAAQAVNGLHTAPLLEADTEAEDPWLTTAFVAGPSLLDAVQEAGPLPAPTVATLVAGMARALESIHGAGIIHRDLKPANVILAADGPRVIDFGIARAADATTARLTGNRVGTPQFMTPEQVDGRPATPALDVFALGAVAYFAATGRGPFGEGDPFALLLRIKDSQPDLTGCPPQLHDMIAACLAKEPSERPSLTKIIEYCQSVNPQQPGPGWLPPTVTRDIEARTAAVAALAATPEPLATTIPQEMASRGYVSHGNVAGQTGGDYPRISDYATPPPNRQRGLQIALAACVALAVVLAAVLIVGRNDGSSKDNQASSQPPTSQAPTSAPRQASPSTASSDTPAPAASLSPTSAPDQIQYTGPVRIGAKGIKLDSVPPAINPDALDYDISMALIDPPRLGGTFPNGANLAIWPGPGMPTRQQCSDLVSTQGISRIEAKTGAVICLKTQGGRTVVLTLTKTSNDFDTGQMAQVSVWSQVSE